MDEAYLIFTRSLLTELLDEDPEFRQSWDDAVRTAADIATAEVSHHWLNGRQHGQANLSFELPIPLGWDREAVGVLFGEDAMAEAQRRLSAMQDKGLL